MVSAVGSRGKCPHRKMRRILLLAAYGLLGGALTVCCVKRGCTITRRQARERFVDRMIVDARNRLARGRVVVSMPVEEKAEEFPVAAVFAPPSMYAQESYGVSIAVWKDGRCVWATDRALQGGLPDYYEAYLPTGRVDRALRQIRECGAYEDVYYGIDLVPLHASYTCVSVVDGDDAVCMKRQHHQGDTVPTVQGPLPRSTIEREDPKDLPELTHPVFTRYLSVRAQVEGILLSLRPQGGGRRISFKWQERAIIRDRWKRD